MARSEHYFFDAITRGSKRAAVYRDYPKGILQASRVHTVQLQLEFVVEREGWVIIVLCRFGVGEFQPLTKSVLNLRRTCTNDRGKMRPREV